MDSTKNMAATSSIFFINDRPISWNEVFGCLQLFGKLQPFLQEFVSQYVLVQELNQRQDLVVDSAELMEAIMSFRLENKLDDRDKFQEWLKSQNLDNSTFQQRIAVELKLKQLREKIAAPDLQSYFDEHQDSLAELQLSCLLISEQDLALELKGRLAAGENDLPKLASEYADGTTRVRYLQQQVQKRALSGELHKPLSAAASGEIVGPVKAGEGWGIFRVEEIIPAVLDDQLKSQIENQLFSQWLIEKIRNLKISFNAESNPVKEQQ